MALDMSHGLHDPAQAPEQDAMAGGPGNERRQAGVLQACLLANYESLRRQLARRLGCPDMATECLHDAWLRMASFDAPAALQSPEAYVYRMACNAAMDRLRGNRAGQYADGAEDLIGQCVDEAPGPERIAAARSDLAALERRLMRLPQRHRAVVYDLRIDGMSREEVAARHGLSLRRVDTALRQAIGHCAMAS